MAEERVTIVVSADAEATRLDKYLSGHPDLDLSRNQIQQLIDNGNILVDGKSPDKKQPVQPGQEIAVTIPPPTKSELKPENIPLDIVFQDDSIVVVNKPAGMVTHPAAGNYSGTLVNALLHHFDELGESDDPERPGIVHRLDKGTSGLLVVARSTRSLRELQAAIQERQVRREYLALICGHLKEDAGTLDMPIGRSHRDRKKMAVTESGREAVTEYGLRARYRSYDLLDVRLQTGRTHQIRVHFAEVGHPVFGDPDYGGRKKWVKGMFAPERPLATRLLGILERQALHAQKLSFDHPITGERMEFTADVPEDFGTVLEVLEQEGQ